MNVINTRKKIIKVRPGHLANFSGGAGYMPFVVLYTIPVSFIGTIVSSFVVHFVARKMLKQKNEALNIAQPVGLAEFLSYSKKHLLILLVVSVIASIISFSYGITLVYGDKVRYSIPTIFMTAGPFLSMLLSLKYLFTLTVENGYKFSNYIISILLYIISTLGFCLFGILLS